MKTTEYNSIVGFNLNGGLDGLVPAKPSFGMTSTKISRLVSSMTRVRCMLASLANMMIVPYIFIYYVICIMLLE